MNKLDLIKPGTIAQGNSSLGTKFEQLLDLNALDDYTDEFIKQPATSSSSPQKYKVAQSAINFAGNNIMGQSSTAPRLIDPPKSVMGYGSKYGKDDDIDDLDKMVDDILKTDPTKQQQQNKTDSSKSLPQRNLGGVQSSQADYNDRVLQPSISNNLNFSINNRGGGGIGMVETPKGLDLLNRGKFEFPDNSQQQPSSIRSHQVTGQTSTLNKVGQQLMMNDKFGKQYSQNMMSITSPAKDMGKLKIPPPPLVISTAAASNQNYSQQNSPNGSFLANGNAYQNTVAASPSYYKGAGLLGSSNGFIKQPSTGPVAKYESNQSLNGRVIGTFSGGQDSDDKSPKPGSLHLGSPLGKITIKPKQQKTEEDDFEFLLQESFERRQGNSTSKADQLSQMNAGARNNIHRIIEEPHQTTEYDVDDLIDELNGNEGKTQKKKVLNSQISEQSGNNQMVMLTPTPQQAQASKAQMKQQIKQGGSTINKHVFDDSDSGFFNQDAISKYLLLLKKKYLSQTSLMTQQGQENLYKRRRAIVRPLEIFSEPDSDTQTDRLRVWISGFKIEGSLRAVAKFEQWDSKYGNYHKLQFREGESIIIVSASVDSTYNIFGFKEETVKLLGSTQDNIEVQAIESTTVQPLYEKWAPGLRTYNLSDFDELGLDLKALQQEQQNVSLDLVDFGTSSKTYGPGVAPIVPELFLAIRDFNPEDRERSQEEIGMKILAYRTGELIVMTLKPNKGGWYEGYRFNDPERLCGIGHVSTVKKVNFN